MPRKKEPKFGPGDKVYIKRAKTVIFGEVNYVYEEEKLKFRNKRFSTRMRFRYRVHLEEQYTTRTRVGERNRKVVFVAESSLRRVPENEEELARILLGEDYL